MVVISFDLSKSLMKVTPTYLASMTTCPVSKLIKHRGSHVHCTRIMLYLDGSGPNTVPCGTIETTSIRH